MLILMDTRSGDGIEAQVSLKEEEMAMLQKIPELLTFAALDPSPFGTLFLVCFMISNTYFEHLTK